VVSDWQSYLVPNLKLKHFQTQKNTLKASNILQTVTEDSAAREIHVDKNSKIATMENLITDFQALDTSVSHNLDKTEANAKIKVDKVESKKLTRIPNVQGVSFIYPNTC